MRARVATARLGAALAAACVLAGCSSLPPGERRSLDKVRAFADDTVEIPPEEIAGQYSLDATLLP